MDAFLKPLIDDVNKYYIERIPVSSGEGCRSRRLLWNVKSKFKGKKCLIGINTAAYILVKKNIEKREFGNLLCNKGTAWLLKSDEIK